MTLGSFGRGSGSVGGEGARGGGRVFPVGAESCGGGGREAAAAAGGDEDGRGEDSDGDESSRGGADGEPHCRRV